MQHQELKPRTDEDRLARVEKAKQRSLNAVRALNDFLGNGNDDEPEKTLSSYLAEIEAAGHELAEAETALAILVAPIGPFTQPLRDKVQAILDDTYSLFTKLQVPDADQVGFAMLLAAMDDVMAIAGLPHDQYEPDTPEGNAFCQGARDGWQGRHREITSGLSYADSKLNEAYDQGLNLFHGGH